jgi:hypothetical protein
MVGRGPVLIQAGECVGDRETGVGRLRIDRDGALEHFDRLGVPAQGAEHAPERAESLGVRRGCLDRSRRVVVRLLELASHDKGHGHGVVEPGFVRLLLEQLGNGRPCLVGLAECDEALRLPERGLVA